MFVNRRRRIADAWRARLWPVPTVGIVAALVAGFGLTEVDAALDDTLPEAVSDLMFGGAPGAAREILGTIAGSLITVTSLTFSLTLVTLQLASSQFSPRLLRTFAQDRFVQRTLALFLATFVYAVTVLRRVRDATPSTAAFVPEISVTVAYLLTVVSVIALVLFLAHLVREIRVETMLDNVHADGVAVACDLLPAQGAPAHAMRQPPPRPPSASVITATSAGFLVQVDEDALLATAREESAVIVVDCSPGTWLVDGTPVAAAWPDEAGVAFEAERAESVCHRVRAAIHTGNERTPVQDCGYALQQLSDVAVKALSPGINDPTTAIHALGHSSALLCNLAGRRLGPVVLCDDADAVRVVVARPRLDTLLEVALAQPRRYGAADAVVLMRMMALLREVARHVPAGQRAAIRDQLDRLNWSVAQQRFDPGERSELDRAARDVEAQLATTELTNP